MAAPGSLDRVSIQTRWQAFSLYLLETNFAVQWELVESGSVCREGLTDALERLSNLVRVVPNVQTDPRAQKSVSGMLSPKRAIEASSLPSQPHGPRQKGCGVTVTARSWAGSVQSSIFWT